jgi:octaprenyl-diphosphate synthase
VARTGNQRIVEYLAELGRTLSNGEILQLTNIQNQEISEDVYYQVIKQKTAALFEACAGIGALSTGGSEEEVAAAKQFGQNLGIIFQIRDDIFDYYDGAQIGKPTGNDMAEGKLTLPVIYALNSNKMDSMMNLALKVKQGGVNADEIAVLVEFSKKAGGIEYAEQRMRDYHRLCQKYIEENVKDKNISDALTAYIDFVIERKS